MFGNTDYFSQMFCLITWRGMRWNAGVFYVLSANNAFLAVDTAVVNDNINLSHKWFFFATTLVPDNTIVNGFRQTEYDCNIPR